MVPFSSESEQGDNAVAKYYGDYRNEHMPSIINIMIKTVFNGGAHDKDEIALIPSNSVDAEYNIGIALLLIVIALVPVMLLVKPCCCSHHGPEDDRDEIEFTNIRNPDNEMQQNLI